MKQFLLKYGLVSPVLLLLIAMNVFPLFYNLILGFTNKEYGMAGFDWVGGANYSAVFTDSVYAQSLRTTALFVLAAVLVELLMGFGLALCLRDIKRGKTLVLTLLLIPMMLSPVVMGVYWNLLMNQNYGIINLALGALTGGDLQPAWLTGRKLKLVSILIIDIWMWTPFMMLISLAGLNAIPRHLYEAAEVDRAGAFTVFRRITLPLCAPLLGLAVLFRTTDALKQFDIVMAITGAGDARTQTLSVLIYQEALQNYQIGSGSAFATVVLVFVIAIATIFTRYIARIQRRQAEAP